MQVLLAPSKTMKTEYPDSVVTTNPRFLDQAQLIVNAVNEVKDIEGLMKISPGIAGAVRSAYIHWNQWFAPAIYAYRGDVYRWFFADTLAAADLKWAQEHVVILSGLYGAVRPLDMISPYRLEMKTRLNVGGKRDLYAFWGRKIAAMIDETADVVICNLASEEYSRVVTKYTQKRIITPVFLDKKGDGTIGAVPIYSKMMRGVMARWIIDHRISSPVGLRDFSMQGYHYDKARSSETVPAFYRANPKPIRF